MAMAGPSARPARKYARPAPSARRTTRTKNHRTIRMKTILSSSWRRKQSDIDDRSHRLIARPVGMQSIPRTADGAVWHELLAKGACFRIHGCCVEVGNGVEEAAGADEAVDGLTPLVGVGGARVAVRR